MSTKLKSYHLDKLIAFVGDDPDAIKNMVGIFLHTTPELLETINQSYKQKQPEQMAKAAHSLKPTLDVFGVDSVYDVIRKIEQKAKNATLDDELAGLINTLNGVLETVFEQLKKAFVN